MIPSMFPAQNSAPVQHGGLSAAATGVPEDDDIALGWECANPALQIEVWGTEAAEAAN